MQKNYEESFKFVLKLEGGYINHPQDPGGPTNYGVTKKSWEDYKNKKVSIEGIKSLKESDVIKFYRDKYWDVCKCDYLPSGVDFCVFDYSVNSGPKKAIKSLQKSLGLIADGIIGKNTLFEIENIKDKKSIILMICEERKGFLKSLKEFSIFGKGWLSRVAKVQLKSKGMINYE
jgi:lysozyme family protein